MSDHHAKPFDEATQTKLFIYKSYVQAWLQVFLHTRKFAGRTLRFFDFFSGPGVDQNGLKGSPMILLDEIAANRDLLEASGKSVEVYFNDSKRSKADALRRACAEYGQVAPLLEMERFRRNLTRQNHRDVAARFRVPAGAVAYPQVRRSRRGVRRIDEPRSIDRVLGAKAIQQERFSPSINSETMKHRPP